MCHEYPIYFWCKHRESWRFCGIHSVIKEEFVSVSREKALNGDVILTTSGMLDGGPVLNYISNLTDQKNGLFLTGYQIDATCFQKHPSIGIFNLVSC